MPALTQGDGDDLVARYKRALETRDVDAVMELYRDDADLRTDPFEEHVTGGLAIRAHWNQVAADRASVEFDAERVWVAGPTVLAAWHGAWTRRETAERVRERGIMTLELDDDRLIVRERHWTIGRVVGTDSTLRPGTPSSAGTTD
jgi:ketosteroid isomerase-like protein